jgi:HK97 family phage prohead protease
MKPFQYKNLDYEVKDIDNVSRRVKVALSRFGNVDSDGDVIIRGAFAKSIQERGPSSQTNRKIQFLRYHDFEQQIGIWESLEETNDYLIGIGKLGRSTKGSDALFDYEDGVIREHSIGFQLLPDKLMLRPDGIREVKEVVLWEGSAVTFGANDQTGVFSVGKSMDAGFLEKLNQKMEACINALKNGNGTDERLFAIEMNLRVMQSKYNEIINSLKDGGRVSPLEEQSNNTQTQISLSNFL